VAVAIDVDHSIGIFDTNTGKQLHILKGDAVVITDIEMRTDDEFATAGIKHFKLWNMVNGGPPTSKRGAFGTGENWYSDICTTLKSFGKQYLSGTGQGDLIVWMGNNISKKSKKKLFNTFLDAIHTTNEYAFVGDWAGNIIIFNDQI